MPPLSSARFRFVRVKTFTFLRLLDWPPGFFIPETGVIFVPDNNTSSEPRWGKLPRSLRSSTILRPSVPLTIACPPSLRSGKAGSVADASSRARPGVYSPQKQPDTNPLNTTIHHSQPCLLSFPCDEFHTFGVINFIAFQEPP